MNRRQFLGTTARMGSAIALVGCGGTRVHMPLAAAGALDAEAFHRSRRYVRIRSGNIAYVERGSGHAALFLHGFPLNAFQWRGALERLAPYRRCIAPDLLGMGFTQVAEGQGVAPDDQVAMLVAFLDQLGVGSVDLVASDSGGAVAQLLLVRHPQRVRTLLLTNCDTEMESPPPAMLPVIALARQGTYVDQWLAPWMDDPVLARSPEGIGGMCYSDPAHPTDEAIETYFGPLLSTDSRKALANAYAVALERNPLTGIAPALQRSRAPVRIVWGRADTIFSDDNAGYLDRTCAGSRGVRWLDDGKLFWPEERPDVIAEEARALWNAWASSAPAR